MEFLALLKPDDHCNIGCHGTGILNRMCTWPDRKPSSVETICACCKFTVLSKDPDQALEELAKLTGRKLRLEGIRTPAEYVQDIKERINK